MAIDDALRVGGKPLAGGQFRETGGLAKPAPLIVVADREHHRAVPRVERVVWHDAAVGIAHPRGIVAGRQVRRGLVGEQRRHGIEHGNIDMPAAAGGDALQERQQDPLRRKQA
jgi:hypothetical protein